MTATTIALTGTMAWFPAHKSTTVVGHARFSNGDRLSCVVWGASTLVDILVKKAARHLGREREVLSLLESAEARAAHAACFLGVVTHADRHYHQQILRVFVDKPRLHQSISAPAIALQHAPVCAKEVFRTVLKAWVATSPKVQTNRQQRAANCEAWLRSGYWV